MTTYKQKLLLTELWVFSTPPFPVPNVSRFDVIPKSNQPGSRAPVSQLMNAEVNSGNHKAVIASHYATRICGRYATLRERIMYKQLNYTRTLIPSDKRGNTKVDVCVLLVILPGCQWTKKASSFSSKNLRIFFLTSFCCRNYET